MFTFVFRRKVFHLRFLHKFLRNNKAWKKNIVIVCTACFMLSLSPPQMERALCLMGGTKIAVAFRQHPKCRRRYAKLSSLA